MTNANRKKLARRSAVPVVLALLVGLTVFVWYGRISEPVTALEGQTFQDVLLEIEAHYAAQGIEACVESEVLSIDVYSEPHGLNPHGMIPT